MLLGETDERMIDHEQVEGFRQNFNWAVGERLQGPLFPSDRDIRMQFPVTLRGRDHWRESPRMVPSDASQLVLGGFHRCSETWVLNLYWRSVASFRLTPRPGLVGTPTVPSWFTGSVSFVICQRSGERLVEYSRISSSWCAARK